MGDYIFSLILYVNIEVMYEYMIMNMNVTYLLINAFADPSRHIGEDENKK